MFHVLNEKAPSLKGSMFVFSDNLRLCGGSDIVVQIEEDRHKQSPFSEILIVFSKIEF